MNTTTSQALAWYCDHTDEPRGESTHEGWRWTPTGHTWQRDTNVLGETNADTATDERRCPRARLVRCDDPDRELVARLEEQLIRDRAAAERAAAFDYCAACGHWTDDLWDDREQEGVRDARLCRSCVDYRDEHWDRGDRG